MRRLGPWLPRFPGSSRHTEAIVGGTNLHAERSLMPGDLTSSLTRYYTSPGHGIHGGMGCCLAASWPVLQRSMGSEWNGVHFKLVNEPCSCMSRAWSCDQDVEMMGLVPPVVSAAWANAPPWVGLLIPSVHLTRTWWGMATRTGETEMLLQCERLLHIRLYCSSWAAVKQPGCMGHHALSNEDGPGNPIQLRLRQTNKCS